MDCNNYPIVRWLDIWQARTTKKRTHKQTIPAPPTASPHPDRRTIDGAHNALWIDV